MSECLTKIQNLLLNIVVRGLKHDTVGFFLFIDSISVNTF